jgi:hypothetical protein
MARPAGSSPTQAGRWAFRVRHAVVRGAGTVDAEVWGLPLVILSQLRDTLACVVKVNVLDSSTTLDGPDSTAVPYSNDDTLYSTAFLDLRAGPQLLNLPSMNGRYVNFQLLDMYTNTIADVGVLTGAGHRGAYAFVGPGWHGNRKATSASMSLRQMRGCSDGPR